MKTVRELTALENVPVLLRTSLNVPVTDGKVSNVFRLRQALPTIEYLRERHARVILLSHITGKGTETLEPMYEVMKEWVHGLQFCRVSTGPEARAAVRAMVPGDVLMLENLRRNPGEEKNDPTFVRELAELGDIFVQDCFDVCHRKHASVVGIPELLPAYAGLLVEKEVTELHKALKPKRPSLAIISGAKFSTKEPIIKELLTSYDHVYVGGALGNDFIQAKGFSVGASLVSHEGQDAVRELLKNPRLVTPLDAIVAPHGGDRSQARIATLSDIQPNEAVLDAGPLTVSALIAYVQTAKTVLWNGPLGLFEEGFIDGTHALARVIVNSHAHSIIGGGDTIAAVEGLNLPHEFSFASTGGGAMLDYLADGSLPGLDVLR